MFDFMKIITLRAVYEAKEDGKLPPYLGSTVRGILGHCIRRFVCQKPETKCFVCSRREECPYVRCFYNTRGEAGAVNPYVLYVHTQGKEKWETGDSCVFDLTLFGEAAENPVIYLDALCAAEKMGWGASRMAFRLIRITEPESGRLIYDGGRTWRGSLEPHPFHVEQRKAGSASLYFDTPLRIVSGQELFDSLPFPVLIRFLSSRLSHISAVHTDCRVEWDEEEMMKAAQHVRVVRQTWRENKFIRYSINQKNNKLELDSKMGWVVYEGDLTGFTPLLEAGKYLHVGKGTTIGFGHYEIGYGE